MRADISVRNTAELSDVRSFAATWLERWGFSRGGLLTEDVQLVASELVGNALTHGAPPAALRLHRHPRAVLVEVDDGDPRLPAPATEPDAEQCGGRGLFIVRALAVGWSAFPRAAGGKTVRAAIPVTSG